MNIDTVVTTHIACDLKTAFKGASSTEDLPRIFPGKGPIPGVVKAEVVGGGPIVAGAVRRVQTNDGAVLDETYTHFNQPTDYGYEMTKMKPPLSLFMRKATGAWVFTSEANGTRIVWTYSCELTNPLVAPIAALIVKVFMRNAMLDCLSHLKAGIEKPA